MRSEVLVFETLIADDLIYLPLALVDACIIPERHPIDFNFICHVIGGKSVFMGRGLFLVYISLVATLFFITLVSFKLSYTLAFLTSVSIFAGIPFLSQGTFITGSYPTHGLFFIVLALYLTSRCLTQKDDPKVILLWYLGIFLLFVLTGIAATSLTLSSFIIVPCALYAFAKKRNATPWLLISIMPGLSFVFLQFTGIFSNHYSGLSGWITLSFEQLLSQVASHAASVGIPAYYSLIVVLVVSITLYIYHSSKLFKGRRASEYSVAISSDGELLIILIGISLVGFATSLLPTLFVQGTHPRYTAVPLFFVFCLTFILLQLIKGRFSSQFIKIGCALAALAITLISIIAFGRQHYASYHKLSVDQHEVRSFLSKKSTQFAKNAQILIFFGNEHANFTGGYNHWSTHFARMVTGRTDITAVIGQKSGMVNDPFTGEYSNHGKQYWTSKNGLTHRKKMVGLDMYRPTYIFSLVDHKAYDCIAVFQADNLTIYNVGESGIKMKDQRTPQHPESEELPLTCINYVLEVDDLPVGSVPGGVAKVFDGDISEVIDVVLQDDPYPYFLSFSFKPEIQGEINNSYTETSPPMPVLALPLSVYQVGRNDYKIGIACKEQTGFDFKSVSEWTKVSFEVGADGMGILKINDTVVKIVEDCSAPKKILLGQGFKSRFWKGSISDFEYRSNGQLIN